MCRCQHRLGDDRLHRLVRGLRLGRPITPMTLKPERNMLSSSVIKSTLLRLYMSIRWTPIAADASAD
jgi:hypothetical protein